MVDYTFEVAKGTKDWYGRDTILRNQIRSSLMSVFERYGYDRLETPPIEKLDSIAFKGGGEIQKEVFRLKDQGERDLALRFDQTVPLARYIATNKEIVFPFKRYAIGEVFRDGPTQPEQGRYRVFTQCDVDVLGVKSMAAEAELFALAQDAFKQLGMGNIEVNINNRKLLEGILDYADVPVISRLRTIATLDKLDKIGVEGVRDELTRLRLLANEKTVSNETLRELFEGYDSNGQEFLNNSESLRKKVCSEVTAGGLEEIKSLFRNVGDRSELYQAVSGYSTAGPLLLDADRASKILELGGLEGDNDSVLRSLEKVITSDTGKEGLAEIRKLLEYSNALGFDSVKLNPSLARGLDYYTGTTIEVYLKDRKICPSAILAGGRFDNMVGDFRGGQDIPAVGFSFGLERLAMIMGNNQETPSTCRELYVIPVGNTTDQCLKICHDLREKGLKVDMKMEGSEKIGNVVSFAVKQGIPFVGFVGEDEIARNSISIKNLKTREQSDVLIENVPTVIQGK